MSENSDAMDPQLQSKVFATAQTIHAASLSVTGDIAGNCKNATLALALALAPIQEPVCICQGHVTVEGVSHDHYWCRIGHTIVDPTADQFSKVPGPLIELETALNHYQEVSFFVFTPSVVNQLLQAAQPRLY